MFFAVINFLNVECLFKTFFICAFYQAEPRFDEGYNMIL